MSRKSDSHAWLPLRHSVLLLLVRKQHRILVENGSVNADIVGAVVQVIMGLLGCGRRRTGRLAGKQLTTALLVEVLLFGLVVLLLLAVVAGSLAALVATSTGRRHSAL